MTGSTFAQTGKVKSEKEEIKCFKITFVGQDSTEIIFNANMNTPMLELKRKYCARLNVTPYTSLRYFYCGDRISDDATPVGLGMEQDDFIEVFGDQTGGDDGSI